MVELDEAVTVDLLLLLGERTEDPCEHEYHSNFPRVHEGAGEWLIRIRFTCCVREPLHILFCDRYKKALESRGILICKECDHHYPESDWRDLYTVLGRKGVDF